MSKLTVLRSIVNMIFSVTLIFLVTLIVFTYIFCVNDIDLSTRTNLSDGAIVKIEFNIEIKNELLYLTKSDRLVITHTINNYFSTMSSLEIYKLTRSPIKWNDHITRRYKNIHIKSITFSDNNIRYVPGFTHSTETLYNKEFKIRLN